MCAVVGQLDSLPYSNPGDDYFTYADPATGRLAFMPWGMDESFYAGDIDVSMIHSVLAVQCKATPACYGKFVDNVWDVLAMAERLGWAAEQRPRGGADRAPRHAGHAQVVHDRAGRDVPERHGVFISDRRSRLMGWIPPERRAPHGVMPQP